VARAVFGYCDGMGVDTFVGETVGSIATEPRGGRHFYWDTVFCPDEFGGKTYAEVTEDPMLGIKEKMRVSQSYRALRQFLQSRAKRGEAELFS
jgi:XTP/dITP diphosphohydrolase